MTRKIASAAGLIGLGLAVVAIVLVFRAYRDRVPAEMARGSYTCVAATTHRATGVNTRVIDDDATIVTVQAGGRLTTWRGDTATYELTRNYIDYGPGYTKVVIPGVYGIELRSGTLPASRRGNGYRPEGYTVTPYDRRGSAGHTIETIELAISPTESVTCRRYGSHP